MINIIIKKRKDSSKCSNAGQVFHDEIVTPAQPPVLHELVDILRKVNLV